MIYSSNKKRFSFYSLTRMAKAFSLICNLLLIAAMLINCQTASLKSGKSVQDKDVTQTYEDSADIYIHRGDAHFSTGAFEKAIGLWRVAADKLQNQNNDFLQGKTFLKISKAYQAIGQVSKALDFIDAALQIADKIKDASLQVACLSQKGSIYLGIGQASDAQVHLEQALSLAKKANDQKVLAEVYTHLGNLFTYQRQYEPAGVRRFTGQSI